MRHSERGNSMVEFALAATALIFFVFGILEFGRALFTYHTVSNAARQGARWAMVRGANCSVLPDCDASTNIQTFVQSQIVAVMNASSVTASVSWPGNSTCPAGSNARGCPVSVTVTYPFSFSLPFISSQVLNISSTSQMTIAN